MLNSSLYVADLFHGSDSVNNAYKITSDAVRISSVELMKLYKFHSHEINPIIIPKECKFTELIVKEKHLRLLHGGVTLTLSQIRRKYWIPQGRQLIQKIINRCLAYAQLNQQISYPDSYRMIESHNRYLLLSLVLTSRAQFTSN
ncbi:hypothetical protein TNCV_4772281 [Trichonephila clavipes]|nr:hypothetical protein TNCV_4772281 [Trichonephila clavipes]